MAAMMFYAANRKDKRGKKLRNLPVKRSINLVRVDEKKISLPKALLGILLICVLAGLFSKFFVADRLTAMSKASSVASQKKADLERMFQVFDEYENIEEEYAHVTYDGMTAEELSLVDRSLVLELVKTALPLRKTTSWSLTGNVLTADVSARTLKQLNLLTCRIEKSPIVDTCMLTTANKDEKINQGSPVQARLIIYLQQPVEEQEP